MRRMVTGGITTLIACIILSWAIIKYEIVINILPRHTYILTEINNAYHFRFAIIGIVLLFGVGIFIWGMVSNKGKLKKVSV
jgi:hypothetical protein